MIEIRKKKTFYFVGVAGNNKDVGKEIHYNTKQACWKGIRAMMIIFCSPGIEVHDTTTGKDWWINGTGKKIPLTDESLGLKEIRKRYKEILK